MGALTDTYVEDTYTGVIHSDGPLPSSGVAKLYDGVGTESALSLGKTQVTIDGTLNINGGSLIDYIYPVGSLFLTVVPADPSTLWTGTTWESVAEGRFITGVGTGTDSLGVNKTFTAGNSTSDGEYGHILTVDELPSHDHSPLILQTSEDDNPDDRNDPATSVIANNVAQARKQQLNSAGTSVGLNLPHNNIPPYFAAYVWKRTS